MLHLNPCSEPVLSLDLFDPDELNPYSKIPKEVVNCEKHKHLAYEAAAKSIVLLKNKNHTLPLNKETLKNLLVLGPTAADVTSLLGNYNGFSGELTTFLEGIVGKVDEGTIVEYNQGFMFHNDTLFHGFWQASRADAVVICVGINSLFEGEEGDAMLNPYGGDRMTIELPHNQVKYVQMVREHIKDKPIIVVITGGSAMAIPEIDELADAILFAWYPGEQGGNAVADIIFGNVNPSGRLPVTFYTSTTDLPDFEDYNMEERTYKYFHGETLYPFGYGLSYSEFEYSDLKISVEGEKIIASLSIQNSGENDGDEVVQVYARKIDPKYWRPIKQLIGFKRISLNKGEQKSITLDIDKKQFRYWNSGQQKYMVEPGEYEIMVGRSSDDAKLTKAILL